MLSTIFFSFITCIIILFPIYLWGYGTTLVLGYNWSRVRFFMWLLIGSISVWLMYILERYKNDSDTFFMTSTTLFVLLVLLYGIIFVLTRYGSSFSRVFLRKMAIRHMFMIFLLSLFLLFVSHFFEGTLFFSVFSFSLLFVSLFEEASKHLVSIGLVGHDFHFSKSDILTFTLFSVLGFVFSENLIYFALRDWNLLEWIYRSFFTLLSHIFAASLCAYFWWKWLSYELFSLQYIRTFLTGFILAIGAHTLYNSILEHGMIFGLIWYVIVWYFLLVVLFSRQ